jgi:hypothetical protein
MLRAYCSSFVLCSFNLPGPGGWKCVGRSVSKHLRKQSSAPPEHCGPPALLLFCRVHRRDHCPAACFNRLLVQIPRRLARLRCCHLERASLTFRWKRQLCDLVLRDNFPLLPSHSFNFALNAAAACSTSFRCSSSRCHRALPRSSHAICRYPALCVAH